MSVLFHNKSLFEIVQYGVFNAGKECFFFFGGICLPHLSFNSVCFCHAFGCMWEWVSECVRLSAGNLAYFRTHQPNCLFSSLRTVYSKTSHGCGDIRLVQ